MEGQCRIWSPRGGQGTSWLVCRSPDGYFWPRTQGVKTSWGRAAEQFAKVEGAGGGAVVANSGGGFHHHQWRSDMTSSESRGPKNSHFCFPRSEEEPFLREGGGKSLEVQEGGGHPKGPQLLVGTNGQTPLSKARLQPCPGVQGLTTAGGEKAFGIWPP